MKGKKHKVFKNKVSLSGVIGLCVLAENLIKLPIDIKHRSVFISDENGVMKCCFSMETYKALEAIANADYNLLLEV